MILHREFLADSIFNQLDNTSKENKNQYVFSFLGLLVETEVFEMPPLFLLLYDTNIFPEKSFYTLIWTGSEGQALQMLHVINIDLHGVIPKTRRKKELKVTFINFVVHCKWFIFRLRHHFCQLVTCTSMWISFSREFPSQLKNRAAWPLRTSLELSSPVTSRPKGKHQRLEHNHNMWQWKICMQHGSGYYHICSICITWTIFIVLWLSVLKKERQFCPLKHGVPHNGSL